MLVLLFVFGGSSDALCGLIGSNVLCAGFSLCYLCCSKLFCKVRLLKHYIGLPATDGGMEANVSPAVSFSAVVVAKLLCACLCDSLFSYISIHVPEIQISPEIPYRYLVSTFCHLQCVE